ncbi:MAG: MFS transporter [Tatlockia sp.]|nr:MFS transporter [Tatlockia sp.]
MLPNKKPRIKTTWSAWFICSIAVIYYSYEYLLRIAPSVMESTLRDHFSLSATGFGFLSAFYYYAYVPMQLPVGILLDRYGPKRLLAFACFTCVAGTFLFASTYGFWVAAIGRFLVGFGSAFAFVGVLKLATLWLPQDRLAIVSGITSAFGAIGAMLGDNLLMKLVTQVGWRDTLNYSAYFGVGLTLILWFGIREKKKQPTQSTRGSHVNFKKSMRDFRTIIKNKQIWINGLYGCLVYLPATVFAELWGIPYFEHARGLSSTDAGLANSLLFLGFTLGAPIMGYISDKMRRRKLPMFLGAVFAALIMIIILYVPHLTGLQIKVLVFLLGIAYSTECIIFAVSREVSPSDAAATAMATTNMIVMLGAILLQPIVGHLLDLGASVHNQENLFNTMSTVPLYTASDYQFALSIIPIGIIIAGILVLFLKETYAKVLSSEDVRAVAHDDSELGSLEPPTVSIG